MKDHPLIVQIEDMGLLVNQVYRHSDTFFSVQSPWMEPHNLVYVAVDHLLIHETETMLQERVPADEPLVNQIKTMALLHGFALRKNP